MAKKKKVVKKKTVKKKALKKEKASTRLTTKKLYSTGKKDLDHDIARLIAKHLPHEEDSDLVREMLTTSMKIAEDGLTRGDVKIINTAMKEMRYGLKVFTPYLQRRKVSIFGSARTKRDNVEYKLAREFGRRMSKEDWMVITGASAGIMHAGNEGAGRENSFGLNIRLPFEQDANPIVAKDGKLINFKYFFTRKLLFLRQSDAIVLCPGGFGTQDEGFETLTLVQTGKNEPLPIVCLDSPKSNYWKGYRSFLYNQLAKNGMIDAEDIDLIHFTHDADDAADHILRFYVGYHSMRYIGDILVMRVKRVLEPHELDILNDEFKGIVKKGKIEQSLEPFEDERDVAYTFGLPRLYFHFTRNHFARLRTLIRRINSF